MKMLANLGKWLAKSWAPIALLLGAITAIVQFIQLWRGDAQTVTQVIWIGGTILVWASLYHIGYSRSIIWIPVSSASGVERKERVIRHRYGEVLSKAARTLFFVALLSMITLWGYTIYRNKLLKDKVVVLVANFAGPDPENYRVTEQLLSQLSNSLSGYDDIIITPLGETITEQEGNKKAQDLGKSYRADLVIWGWYGVTKSDVLLTVHVENLSEIDYLPLLTSDLYGTQLPATEIKSFKIQQYLSSQMTALSLFLGGMVRYEANDYQDAIKRFSKALNEQWPDDLISKKFIFFYRGLAYYRLVYFDATYSIDDGFKNGLADFSEAIELDSGFWEAYYFRIMGYSILGDISSAEKDYQLFSAQAPPPETADDYETLAYLAIAAEDSTKALEYIDIVIENEPNNSFWFHSRAMVNAKKWDFKVALVDLNRAIELDPTFVIYYQNRAEIYRVIEEYELALKDINRALDMYTVNNDVAYAWILYGRGRIYSDIENHSGALDDFSKIIQLFPDIHSFYYDRGMSYLQLNEFDLAIQDFSTFLQKSEPNDFRIPDAYYNRGVAFDKHGYLGNALIDYAYAAQFYTSFANSWKDGGYINQAEDECKSAILNFQELSKLSKDKSIKEWADAVVAAFQVACPNSLIETIPTKNWLIEIATNPITPNSGLAGIKIGDSVENVIEHLGDSVGWFRTEVPNVPNCCLLGTWISKNSSLALYIFFSISNQDVVIIYLDGIPDPATSIYLPNINGVSLGTTEGELLLKWGNPTSSRIPETPIGCKELYYTGIRFRTCGENKLINVIEIPGIIE